MMDSFEYCILYHRLKSWVSKKVASNCANFLPVVHTNTLRLPTFELSSTFFACTPQCASNATYCFLLLLKNVAVRVLLRGLYAGAGARPIKIVPTKRRKINSLSVRFKLHRRTASHICENSCSLECEIRCPRKDSTSLPQVLVRQRRSSSTGSAATLYITETLPSYTFRFLAIPV